MVLCAKGGGGNPFPTDTEREIKSEVCGKFYVRCVIKDRVGIIRAIGEFAEKNDISINSVLQTPFENSERVPFVLTTEKTSLSKVQAMCAELAKLDWNLEEPLVMPMID